MLPTLVERTRAALLEAILANKANLARNEVANSVKLLAEAYMLLGDASLLEAPASTEEMKDAPIA